MVGAFIEDIMFLPVCYSVGVFVSRIAEFLLNF